MHPHPTVQLAPETATRFVAPRLSLLPTNALRALKRPRGSSESGQASVEYALVLLGAALVASLLIAWATRTDLLDQLFDHVLNLIKGKAR